MSSIEEVRGREVTIRFEAKKCIHSRNCVLGRPDVFVPNVPGEWIHPDRATAGEVAHLALTCPSGAITFERNDGGPGEPAAAGEHGARARERPARAARRARDRRPPGRLPRDPVPLRRLEEQALLRRESQRARPSVRRGEPATKESEALAVRGGPLAVTPTPNGPLRVQGPLEIVTGTGRTILRTTETYLCRCGASANKPYCDGSHKRIGFTS